MCSGCWWKNWVTTSERERVLKIKKCSLLRFVDCDKITKRESDFNSNKFSSSVWFLASFFFSNAVQHKFSFGLQRVWQKLLTRSCNCGPLSLSRSLFRNHHHHHQNGFFFFIVHILFIWERERNSFPGKCVFTYVRSTIHSIETFSCHLTFPS